MITEDTLSKPTKSFKKSKKSLTPARAIALGFFTVIMFGTFLLCLPISHENGQWFSFVDAFFTATSSVCVTGLAVVDTAIEFSMFGEIVILLLIQIGGLGFMTVATLLFLIIGKRINLKNRMYVQESLAENQLTGVIRLSKSVIIYTLIFELIGTILLSIEFVQQFGWGQGIYKSVFMSISAFCNAGFDIMGSDFGAYAGLAVFKNNPLVVLTIAFLIIFGGLGFAVIADITRNKRFKKFRMHSRIVIITTSILIVVGTIFFMIVEYNNPDTIGNMSFGNKLLNSFFQAVTPRTAGFATVSQSALKTPSTWMTMILMAIGASPASTGGGIKTTTFVVLLLYTWSSIKGYDTIIINKKRVAIKTAQKAVSIASLAIGMVLLSSILISISEMYSGLEMATFENVLFETISAFSTVGLSKGITPYLNVFSRLVLCVVMFVGRIGPMTMGWAMLKWIKKETVKIKYPESDIMIG